MTDAPVPRSSSGTDDAREPFERFIVRAGFTDWTRHEDGYLKPLVDRLWRAWPRGIAQTAPLPPVPIEWARPVGSTFQEMRDNVWKCGLADKGDTILVWVNEGDFWHATMVCGAKEHTLALPSTDSQAVYAGGGDGTFDENDDTAVTSTDRS